MENKGNIFHRGVVKFADDHRIVVGIVSQSACVSCSVNGSCNMSDVKEKEVEIESWKGTYTRGEFVEVIASESQGFRALFVAYILPLIILLITLIVLLQTTGNESLAAAASLGVLVPYYGILYLLKEKIKQKLNFSIRKLN
ncbi:SoxR reducing system RseC family protein [Prolixibacter denitrificans]|uniref:Sigma-E factor negative regulatory protein RseC n=2 Tax=Prolixibacter denitrificans TaxID=1541063 RepID=A0A2P8CCH7_9BACT|nr:SoxR reducing system RseC family protein [Prolixibacter denitrificans]PSK82674.1 sigma-E factor negative regulatory protein RseC [Prolixibacter denitrificans]